MLQVNTMKRIHVLSGLGFGLIICSLMITQTDCQYTGQQCTEFRSPILLSTDGTRAGSIQLPLNRDTYKQGQICEWVITTKEPDYVIRLQVTKCALQGKDLYGECNNDYVDVFDTQDDKPVFIGRFCDRDVGQIYESSGQRMVVRFHSDEAYQFGGFKAAYQAVKPDPQPEESDNTVQLAVGIPVAILVLVLLVVVSVFVVRVYRAKKANSQRRRSFHNIPAEGRVVPRPPRSSGAVSDMAPFVDTHNVMGSNVYDYNSRQLPLQVVVPRRGQESLDNMRSATPPPSYESLGYDTTDLGPYGTGVTPITPPPYEITSTTAPPYDMVVKETVEGMHTSSA